MYTHMKANFSKLLMTAAISLAVCLPARAEMNLSGLTIYASTAKGTAKGGSYWNTRGDDIVYNVYLFTGSAASPKFLNEGDTAKSLDPKFRLKPGTHVICFAGESAPEGPLGINLYFNGDLSHNRITAVATGDGSGNFSVVPASLGTVGQDGPVLSSGSLTFTADGLTVTLTDFQVSSSHPDLVGQSATGPSEREDITGSFTLVVRKAKKGEGTPPSPHSQSSTEEKI